MIPFNSIRDTSDIGIRKEQQTAGGDDGWPNAPAQTAAQENTNRLGICSSSVRGEWVISPF
jgi:hypothetical protein